VCVVAQAWADSSTTLGDDAKRPACKVVNGITVVEQACPQIRKALYHGEATVSLGFSLWGGLLAHTVGAPAPPDPTLFLWDNSPDPSGYPAPPDPSRFDFGPARPNSNREGSGGGGSQEGSGGRDPLIEKSFGASWPIPVGLPPPRTPPTSPFRGITPADLSGYPPPRTPSRFEFGGGPFRSGQGPGGLRGCPHTFTPQLFLRARLALAARVARETQAPKL
jgi:hypothetical protein